jgi:hypothetical protein
MLASAEQDLEEGGSQPLVTAVHYRYQCCAYSRVIGTPRRRGAPALLLLLAACAVQIPPELQSCAPPATPAPLPVGRRPVTTEQLRAHDAAERSARQAAEAALVACADRLTRLNELVRGGRGPPLRCRRCGGPRRPEGEEAPTPACDRRVALLLA